jgi:hypothetical protein
MPLRTSVLVCLLLITTRALAEEPPAALPACEPYSAAADLFNPKGDTALRLASLAKMEAAPDTLDESALYGLGALYRQGREHPAALVDQDLDKARRYLEDASLDGQIEALGSLAELELADGQPMQAMMWAQLFVKAMRVRDRGQGLGYPAYLLRRVLAELPPGSREEQERRLAAFMPAQAEKFTARQARAKAAPDCRTVDEDWPISLATDRARLTRPKGRPALALESASSGFTMFSLSVHPDGSIADVRVIESVPTARMAAQLDPLLREMHFNPVDASAPPRQVWVPLSLNRGEARLLD